MKQGHNNVTAVNSQRYADRMAKRVANFTQCPAEYTAFMDITNRKYDNDCHKVGKYNPETAVDTRPTEFRCHMCRC